MRLGTIIYRTAVLLALFTIRTGQGGEVVELTNNQIGWAIGIAAIANWLDDWSRRNE